MVRAEGRAGTGAALTHTAHSRLNLGCGVDRLRDYLNIDMHEEGADIVGDFMEMEFEDVHEILLSHVLEHFGHRETEAVLARLFSWLRPGGTLTVEVPDMAALVRRDLTGRMLQIAFFGSQQHAGEYHKSGFTLEMLVESVTGVGFLVAGATTFVSENRHRRHYPCIQVVAVRPPVES